MADRCVAGPMALLMTLALVGCFGTPPSERIPTQLVIITPPPSAARSGVPLSQAPVVQLLDADTAVAARSGVAITVVIASGGGTLDGTTTVDTDAGGEAVFGNLVLTGTVGPRTLRFTSPGLTPVTSGPIQLDEPGSTTQ
jgi:hypothetical protein